MKKLPKRFNQPNKNSKNANPEIKIIIIPPVKIKENIINGRFSFQFDLTSVEKFIKFFIYLKKLQRKKTAIILT